VAIIPNSATNPLCGRGTLANNGPANNLGTPFNCNFLFTPQGSVVAQTGTRIGSGPAGTFLGGNGPTGREGTLLSILPSNERINTNVLARFEIAPALEIFAEGKYVRVNAVGNQLGPTFINNTTGSLGNDARINARLDNPFLSPADRATLANAILASGCGYNLGIAVTALTCVPLTPAQTAAIAAGSYRFLLARTLADSPDRDEYFKRDTYRVVGGLRGTFNSDWNYELSGNYGRFDETTDMRGFVNRQRFLLSLDAGRNPTTGQIQCRSQFDPTGAAFPGTNATFAASLAADIAACVPYNPFGAANNAAAVQYFRADIINRSRLEQLNFLGFVNGDLSQLFELPGGPVRFALGAEYRKEKAFNNSDEDADTGITNSVFLGDVNAKPFKVREAFAEVQIPLLKEFPLFHELTISGAGRVSKYNNAVGTAYAYNAGVEWAPFRDLRMRANYGRAVRAPNVSETSFPAIPNFANGFIDPCNANAIGNNPNRAPNCAAVLTPAQLANLPLGGYSIGVISGSNANLTEETSDSYTVGGVFTPRFLPGFSLSVDYYDINVDDVIVTLAAQTIINGCFDSPGLSSSLCSLVQRNTGTTAGPFGELPGQVLFNTLVQGPNNFASRIRRGIDFEVAYRGRLYGNAKFDTRLIYTHQIANSNFQDPARPKFENRILSELGDPQDEFRWDVDVTLDPITLGYNMRYIGKQLTSTYENFFSLNGEAPLNADAFDVRDYPAVVYHNLRLDWRIGSKADDSKRELNFYLGVDNVTNRQPPFGTTATGAGSAIYNIRGRNYYAGFRARF
jgi:outer membrane receptor protein involved in Fe transport